jgi:predicted amidophosphoribosyltransferase
MTSWNKCPACGTTTSSLCSYCPQCGEPWTIECAGCGRSWRFWEQHSFCPHCGTPVEKRGAGLPNPAPAATGIGKPRRRV